MPIIKFQDKTFHFAHVPKCAGTSIERYIRMINGAELAFVDMHYVAYPSKDPWNVSSPQHIDGESFSRLFPKTYFDGFFVVVREPLSRVISAYKFNRFKEGKIAADQTLDIFIQDGLKNNVEKIGWMDNHFLPQHKFLYPKTSYRVFKLETGGLEPVKSYIDKEIVGATLDLEMPRYNIANKRKAVESKEFEISQASVDIINQIYQQDFQRFKYFDAALTQ